MDQKLLIADREANELIRRVVQKLRRECAAMKFDALSLAMDLTVCHNAEHVDLVVLLDARPGDFLHDLLGIHQYLDRETGEMRDCFLPRCRRRLTS